MGLQLRSRVDGSLLSLTRHCHPSMCEMFSERKMTWLPGQALALTHARPDAHARLARVAPAAQAAGRARRAVRGQRLACWRPGGGGWTDVAGYGLLSQTSGSAGSLGRSSPGRLGTDWAQSPATPARR